jgi:hypothetical protein
MPEQPEPKEVDVADLLRMQLKELEHITLLLRLILVKLGGSSK